MLEIIGKHSTAKIMVDEVEDSCMTQIKNFVDHPAFTNPIAIMPDTHAGIGSVIGFTMRLTNKVIPNVIGVDIGCFIKSTKVSLADGRELTFEQLIEEHDKGLRNFCFSKDDKGNIVIEEIFSPRKTRTVTELIEITLDNDEVITCTVDHIFYDINCQEVKVSDINKGQSLYPLYIEKSGTVQDELSKISKKFKLRDYLVVYNPKTYKYDYIHILADDYNLRHHVYEKSKSIRHHIDFDKHNNNPTNITRMQWKDHFVLHSKHAKQQNIKGKSGWSAAWRKNKDRFSEMSSKKMKKLHEDALFKERLKIRAKTNRKKYLESDAFYEMTRDAGNRGKKYLVAYSKSEKGRNKSSEIGRNVVNQKYRCSICNKTIKSARACPNHFNRKDHKQCNLNMSDMILLKNHTVKSIKRISCEPTDVYCFTTRFSNFALASGVFVHNCGMLSINIGKTLPISLEDFDTKIRQRIPFGQEVHDEAVIRMDTDFPWKIAISKAEAFAAAFRESYRDISVPRYCMDWFLEKCDTIGGGARRVINSLGTLGGGNHFIETGVSTTGGDYWITIHSGSRNFGLKVCNYWQSIAAKSFKKERTGKIQEQIEEAKRTLEGKELYDRIKEIKRSTSTRGIDITHLEWLENEVADGYLFDMIFAQLYASVNRSYMAKLICDVLGVEIQDSIESIHNFIDFNDFIIRKGAISSYIGEPMIIPFNMRDGILICEGKSNKEWNYSAPHGAGRLMSRTQANKRIDLDTFKSQMNGIFSTSVCKSTLDEAPDAYKSSTMIEQAIEPTAAILNRIKPIHNMKDSSEFQFRRKKQ